MKTKLTLFVTVLAVALFGVGCASVKITEEQLQNGLVAFYPFNGNAMDGSGNGNHGEVNGATLGKDRHGAEDKAYKFDGTDDDIRVNKLSGAFKDQITISVWVKAASKRQHEFTIIRKESHEYDWGLQIMQSNGVNFGMVTEDMQVGFTSPTRANSIVNNWAHVIAVRDTSNMYVYLNGEKIGEHLISGKIKSGSPSFTIGSIASRGFHFAKGLIDDVRIYNRALSAAEVKALYDLEKPKSK